MTVLLPWSYLNFEGHTIFHTYLPHVYVFYALDSILIFLYFVIAVNFEQKYL
jgi:hypothetical protein